MATINIHSNRRNDAIKFVNDQGLMIVEAKIVATEVKLFKISTPRQMIQRLPIVIAQIIAGNTSEDLLNEIYQTVYSQYQVKENI